MSHSSIRFRQRLLCAVLLIAIGPEGQAVNNSVMADFRSASEIAKSFRQAAVENNSILETDFAGDTNFWLTILVSGKPDHLIDVPEANVWWIEAIPRPDIRGLIAHVALSEGDEVSLTGHIPHPRQYKIRNLATSSGASFFLSEGKTTLFIDWSDLTNEDVGTLHPALPKKVLGSSHQINDQLRKFWDEYGQNYFSSFLQRTETNRQFRKEHAPYFQLLANLRQSTIAGLSAEEAELTAAQVARRDEQIEKLIADSQFASVHERYIELVNRGFEAPVSAFCDRIQAYIMKEPESYIGISMAGYYCYRLLPSHKHKNQLNDDWLNLFGDSIKQTDEYNALVRRKLILNNTDSGRYAPVFELPDRDENMISLSSFRGNYVLVHFWLSWCRWCKLQSARIERLYSRYAGDNLEVLYVSLDEDRDAWVQALEREQWPWTQLIDVRGLDNSVIADLYSTYSIPLIVFIAPDGKIIRTDLRDTEIDDELRSAFGH